MGTPRSPSSEVVFGTHQVFTEEVVVSGGVFPFNRIQDLTLGVLGSATDCGKIFGDTWPFWLLEVMTGFHLTSN